MDEQTFEKTQFNEIKQQAADCAISMKAKKVMLERQPSASLEVVKTWQKETEEAKQILMSQQHVPFMGLKNIESLTGKISKGLILEPSELIEYADFLRSSRLMQQFFAKNQFLSPTLYAYSQSLTDFSLLEDDIYEVIRQNRIVDDASRDLKKIRRQIVDLEKEIEEKMRKFLRYAQNQGMIQESLILKKKDRWTIPIKATYKNKVNGTIIETSQTGSTVFVEPQAISKISEELQMAQAMESAEEYQILAHLTGMIAEQMELIQFVMEVMIEFDLIFARAKYSRQIDGRMVQINKSEKIVLKQAYHPLLDNTAVPLNLSLGNEFRGLAITGPNAGGKTVVLKTIGLLTLMTMFGLQIRSEEGTMIAVMDEIWIDVGDEQSIENSLSTFSGHMKRLAQITKSVKRNTLVLLDEIGSGTDPKEGAALALAIMEEIYQRGALLVVTTHYGELKDFALCHADFMTAAMAFDSVKLMPTYHLLLGETGDSNAFWIAQKMELGQRVIERAQEYLAHSKYQTKKIEFTPNRKDTEVDEKVLPITFHQGDKVYYLEEGQKIAGLVFEDDPQKDYVKVFIEGEITLILRKRLKLMFAAVELYPEGYDLGQLFEEYDVRKERRDLERGSKKAWKKWRKKEQ